MQLKRVELFKADLYYSVFHKCHNEMNSCLQVKNLFNTDINKIRLLRFYNTYRIDNEPLVGYYYDYVDAHSMSYDFTLCDFLLQDIEVKTNKDFYLRSLFYEIFHLINFYSDDATHHFSNFVKKSPVHFSICTPQDLYKAIDSFINNDAFCKQLVILYFKLLNSIDNLAQRFIPSFFSINTVLGLIHPLSNKHNLSNHKVLMDFFDKHYHCSKTDLHKIKLNLHTIENFFI